MNRSRRWFPWVLIVCLWVTGAHAADPAGKNQKSKVPETTTPSQKDAPSIQFPETVFEFGEVMEGTDVIHDFIVKNTGKGTLQIDQVRPG